MPERSSDREDSKALIEALTKEVQGLREDLTKEAQGLREDLKSQLAPATQKAPLTKLLERGQHVAAILGVLITLFALVVAAYSFTHNSELQAEDAAYRATQEHQKVRTDMSSGMSELVSTLESNPERINDRDVVPNEVFTQYDSVADHGLTTVEWIYRTRVDRNIVQGTAPIEATLRLLGFRNTESDAGWKSTVEGWIRVYRAAIYAGLDAGSLEDSNFEWCDYSENFVNLIQTHLVEYEGEQGNADSRALANRIPDRVERNNFCQANQNEL